MNVLQAKGVQQVLVKLGKDGCILYGAEEQPIRQNIFPVEKVATSSSVPCVLPRMLVTMQEFSKLTYSCLNCPQDLSDLPLESSCD